MPVRRICPKTGAVIYDRTPEEQRMADMEKELAELKKQISSLTTQNTKKK